MEAIGRREDRAAPIPTVLLSQARLAARSGVSLDTVLRRYFAGYTLLGDFLIEEAEGSAGIPGSALKGLLRTQAALFDRLIAAVSEEYGREAVRPGSAEERKAERVKRLLAGELVDTSDLGYELEGWHLGVLGAGPRAPEAVRGVADSLDRQLLMVVREEGVAWAWLGGREAIGLSEIQRAAHRRSWPDLRLAIGEPGAGLAGWRLSHRQARAALPVALRGSDLLTRYAEVALLASTLRDELLATSLRDIFLTPLARERGGGEATRETLRAYFAAERNVSSAAAALGASRHTVAKRLREVEELLGRRLSAVSAELETALRFEDFEEGNQRRDTSSAFAVLP